MPEITLMSDDRQNEIVEAVKAAADLHSAGMDPSEAVAKTAKDIEANEHVLQRMVEAFNTAATLAHMKTAEEGEKANSFPLADYEKAKAILLPANAPLKVAVFDDLAVPDMRQVKVAMSSFYGCIGDKYKVNSGDNKGKVGVLVKRTSRTYENEYLKDETKVREDNSKCEVTLKFTDGSTQAFTKPDTELSRHYDDSKTVGECAKAAMEKAAYNVTVEEKGGFFPPGTPLQTDMDERKLHTLRETEFWKRAAREKQVSYETNKHLALEATAKLASIFRQANRPSWEKFEAEALVVNGPEIKPYLDAVFAEGCLGSVKCARAEKATKLAYVADDTTEHKLLKIIKLSTELAAESGAESCLLMNKYESTRAEILGLMQEKTAYSIADVGAIAEFAKGHANKLDTEPTPKVETFDPNPNVGLESALSKAKLQATIRDMMAEDDVIAQHATEDPNRVLKAIENLSKLQPKILEMPAALQAGVKRMLEMGNLEPFEMKQMQTLGQPSAPAPQPQA